MISLSCTQKEEEKDQFEQDLSTLQSYFHIPGMAAIVKKGDQIVFEKYLGYADLEQKVEVDANTIFPIASLTKIFAATLVFQLEAEGKISLEDPIKKYVPTANISEDVKIKHILSHTSQGQPGEQFFYSFRFAYLTQVIEMASGRSFREQLEDKILRPLDLKNTFLLVSEQQVESLGFQIAQPYTFRGKIEKGKFELGYSASAGLMMNAKDLLLFDKALNEDLLISEEGKKKMFSRFYKDSPYGLGIFIQEIDGLELIWGYGQYDCFSSLYLKIPDKDLTLILLANNNLMSNPARLIYGDITYSLFAISFLKNYVYDFSEKNAAWTESIDLPSNMKETLSQNNPSGKQSTILAQQTLAWGLAKSFMGQAFEEEMKESLEILSLGTKYFDEQYQHQNLSLMHALLPHLGNNTIDNTFLKVGEKLLKECPENPYANLYLGEYYASQDQQEKALMHFKTIVDAQNYERFWYTSEALNFIRQYYQNKGEAVPERYKN